VADDETTQESEETTDTGGQSGTKGPSDGPLTPTGQGVSFSAQQQDYVNKLLADERRTTLRKFKESDEFKTVAVRARRADELEGQGRQEVEELSEALAKAKAERAQALAQAEHSLQRAQVTAILAQRGVPSDRIADATVLLDRSGIKVDLAQGSVTGAEEAVQALVESRPWLVGPGLAPQHTQNARPAPNLNGGVTSAPVTDEARIAAVMEEMRARGHGRL
jgi:hypothetical protein